MEPMPGWQATGRPAAPCNCDLQRLQLCIDRDASPHPSDAGFQPDRSIFAAFA
jgi:hypothetical protein